jgi:hypothetical protein
MDTWVFRVSVAIPLICLVALGLWHLIALLARKFPGKPRPRRESPEPPAPLRSGDDPERLQQVCNSLEISLAEKYLELAEVWRTRGQPDRATIALNRVAQVCPGSSQALVAQDRLQQFSRGSPTT